jgi:hypothetical protein
MRKNGRARVAEWEQERIEELALMIVIMKGDMSQDLKFPC